VGAYSARCLRVYDIIVLKVCDDENIVFHGREEGKQEIAGPVLSISLSTIFRVHKISPDRCDVIKIVHIQNA
jgi:hypothetical protein